MSGRGGLRIDHILGLLRLWVLPRGADAGQGVYLRYPFDDLINLLVLESWRHRCVLIGEDLGVVPPGMRQRLAARGILGIEVLPFARNGARFAPRRSGAAMMAMPSTHDRHRWPVGCAGVTCAGAHAWVSWRICQRHCARVPATRRHCGGWRRGRAAGRQGVVWSPTRRPGWRCCRWKTRWAVAHR